MRQSRFLQFCVLARRALVVVGLQIGNSIETKIQFNSTTALHGRNQKKKSQRLSVLNVPIGRRIRMRPYGDGLAEMLISLALNSRE